MKTTIFATAMLAAVIAGCDFSEVESGAYYAYRGTLYCPYCNYTNTKHPILAVSSRSSIVKDTYIVTLKSECPEHLKPFWVTNEYLLREKGDGTKQLAFIRNVD